MKARRNQKEFYDRSSRGIMPECGDLVLVRKVGLKGKHKLADRWEEEIYVVTQKDPELPFYVVKKEGKIGKERTIHRNHVMPVTWPVIKEFALPVTRKNKVRKTETHSQSEHMSASASSSEEEEQEQHTTVHITVDPIQKGSRNDCSKEVLCDTEHLSRSDLKHELVEEESSAVEVPVEFADEFSDSTVHEGINVTKLDDNIQSGDETMLDTDIGQEVDTNTGLIVNDEVFSEEKPPVRRSGRERRKPEWLRGGDFVVSQQNVFLKFPDWERRCQFLTNLVSTFPNQEERILNVILGIVSEK